MKILLLGKNGQVGWELRHGAAICGSWPAQTLQPDHSFW